MIKFGEDSFHSMIQIFDFIKLMIYFYFSFICRFAVATIRRSKSAGRCICQRSPATKPDSYAYRGIGAPRHPAMRHLASTASQPRLCIKDPGTIPWDGLHSARCHRWFQAARDNAQSSQLHSWTEAKRPRHFRVGNPWSSAVRGRVRQKQCPQC